MTDQQKAIDNCYAIEDNKKALGCLKKVVSKAQGTCRPKLVLLTQEGCLPCKQEKARHKKAIASGSIQELSIDTPEGIKVALDNEIKHFPSLVLLDCRNKLIFPSV